MHSRPPDVTLLIRRRKLRALNATSDFSNVTEERRVPSKRDGFHCKASGQLTFQSKRRPAKAAQINRTRSCDDPPMIPFAAVLDHWALKIPVCTENLSSGVVVVKSAKDGV
jgi:hypothetical protein